MTTTIIANLEKLIGSARDGALLRYSLGSEWLKAGDPARAAAKAYAQGIAVAEARGDVQAAKEMRVFLRRLEKSAGGGARED